MALPNPFISLQTDAESGKESIVFSWVPGPRQKSAGLVAIQLKSRHGVLTDHLSPRQARELGEFLLDASLAAQEREKPQDV